VNGEAVVINPELSIPVAELTWRATRSGGPGGQHVNTSATRVELTWNIATSPSLDETQRQRLLDRLASRLDSSGVIRFVEGRRRSQLQNRTTVTERFAATIARALEVPRPRRKTRPSRAAKEKRLREKKQRSDRKRQRERPSPDE
jgi:ribosome-associated protein